MKKVLIIMLSIFFFSCSILNHSGEWENIIETENGEKISTTLTITESFDEFSAVMTTKLDGEENENLQISNNKIEFYGYINNKILVITDVNTSSNSAITSRSRLTISNDGKNLTLKPGNITFKRL